MEDEIERISAHFRGRVVLLTGGLGFVGSRLGEVVRDAGASLRILHRVPTGTELHVPGATLIQGDVRDADLWDRVLPGVETVFHLAAQTSARESERDPLADYRTNTEAMWRLLDSARRLATKLDVIFAGTETECGIPPRLPLTGEEPDKPLSHYDLHKLIAEQVLEFHARRGHVRGTTLRLPTVYGNAPAARGGSPDCGVINRMIRTALSGAPLQLYGAGDRLRDYVHVGDIATAFALAACSLDRCNGRHYLVGSGERRTVSEAVHLIASTVERVTGSHVPIHTVDPPPGEPEIARHGFAIDTTAFRAATGWTPRWTFEDGIADTVRALKSASERTTKEEAK
jgi:nucleoside-diphosphate-sugar epimerase